MKKELCDEICSVTMIHQETIHDVRGKMQSQDVLLDMSTLFKVMGDKTRLSILNALLNAEMCVCDISCLLNMSQSSISHQLRVLKQAKLVKSRKEGKVVYYSLDDDHVRQMFDQALHHVME